MGSINAQAVAMEVSESIRLGKSVKLGKILKKKGYSDSTSLSPTLVTKTKSYKQAMAVEAKPIIEGMKLQIEKFKEALASRDLSGEETRSLVYALDIFIKNYQLLSGGATERQVFVIPSEVMDRHNITSGEKEPLTEP